MSDWNTLESKLHRWTPRQPSPELRRRIFQRSAPKTAARTHFTDFSRWVIPAFGCFLLMFGTLSSRYQAHEVFPVAMTNLLVADSSNGYNDVVLASRADHSDINSLPAQKLEWSFGSRASTGGLGQALVSYTNKIIQ